MTPASSGWPGSALLQASAYRSWLVTPGSLTQRLGEHCDTLTVRRLFQGLQRPFHDEAGCVGLTASRYAHVREVLLVADGVPVVFAHSITAPESLRGAWRALSRLGERPLTLTLFGDRRVTRGALAFRVLDRRHPLHRRVAELGLEPPVLLWARRSQFLREDCALLVTEVFLPAVLTMRER